MFNVDFPDLLELLKVTLRNMLDITCFYLNPALVECSGLVMFDF